MVCLVEWDIDQMKNGFAGAVGFKRREDERPAPQTRDRNNMARPTSVSESVVSSDSINHCLAASHHRDSINGVCDGETAARFASSRYLVKMIPHRIHSSTPSSRSA